MLVALPTSQLIPMIASFVAMFGFAGLALWLWLRQRKANEAKPTPRPAAETKAADRPRPDPATTRAAAGELAKPNPPSSAPATPAKPLAPELDPTEFVALPGNREDDSPRQQERTHDPTPVHAEHEPGPEQQPEERTELIPAPLELVRRPAPEPVLDERTTVVAPIGVDPHAATDERTAFIAPPPPEPAIEPTTFVAPPPPEPAIEPTTFVAPPPPEPAIEPTAVVPVDHDAPPPAPTSPEPAIEPTAVVPVHHDAPPAPPSRAPAEPRRPPPQLQRRPPPQHAYEAPEAPEAPGPSSSGGPTSELRELVEQLVSAHAKLEAGDASQGSIVAGYLELLAAAPIDPLLELLRPRLASAQADPAWQALFGHKAWPARQALPALLAGLDASARREALRSLASWPDPRAEGLARAGLEAADGPLRAAWLELFGERGWDPGEAALDRTLRSSDAAELAAGLRLAGLRSAEQLGSKVVAQLFAPDPQVRLAAIEAGLVFREHKAWLLCRQLARNPKFPGAAELVGLLGSDAELRELAEVTALAGSPPLCRALGLSGRPVALRQCAALLDDPQLRSAAGEALELACGRRFESASAASEGIERASAAQPRRLILGEPRTLDALARALAGDSPLPLRHAIARELRVRGAGRVALTPALRPRAWQVQLSQLAALAIDLDAEFPWDN